MVKQSLLVPALVGMAMATSAHAQKPLIAVFSGPTATIQNSQPLITSNAARKKYGLQSSVIRGKGLKRWRSVFFGPL